MMRRRQCRVPTANNTVGTRHCRVLISNNSDAKRSQGDIEARLRDGFLLTGNHY